MVDQACTVGLGELVIAILLFLGLVVAFLLNVRQDVRECLQECFATTLCFPMGN